MKKYKLYCILFLISNFNIINANQNSSIIYGSDIDANIDNQRMTVNSDSTYDNANYNNESNNSINIATVDDVNNQANNIEDFNNSNNNVNTDNKNIDEKDSNYNAKDEIENLKNSNAKLQNQILTLQKQLNKYNQEDNNDQENHNSEDQQNKEKLNTCNSDDSFNNLTDISINQSQNYINSEDSIYNPQNDVDDDIIFSKIDELIETKIYVNNMKYSGNSDDDYNLIIGQFKDLNLKQNETQKNQNIVTIQDNLLGFISEYQESNLLPNAYYWTAETYKMQNNFNNASLYYLKSFAYYQKLQKQNNINKHLPIQPAEILLNLAEMLIKLEKTKEATAIINKIKTSFPKESKILQNQLKKLEDNIRKVSASLETKEKLKQKKPAESKPTLKTISSKSKTAAAPKPTAASKTAAAPKTVTTSKPTVTSKTVTTSKPTK